ncbi:histidyl-tRNA synthase [Herbaspirillum rubrisubalbicans]|jgi:histidyl-tRNA synthetase|uniref:Histidine--tRNA ligase n=2 Tax=Herbaspirillum rubrisubalbicans TaxID=80842 RepID=A0AAD0XI52_9BURK|nr:MULTISPECIES: histidine--tRNA ligase [Herbaspirillum]ALU90143.1 histidyl-tRNA synthetase protein [Herbaspirillum rubrisubalbicans M1]AYR25175.1 histidine--tRNA ligase [Herbaspirillum rubrisubalbicans]QJQ01809.1 histidine--tRNA ligase [Herbaspirillum rubrisubalbicans Os34]RAM64905.1 histidyl-tRNA synthase [Herbaspirillum rubrisubalbicans]RAN48132.1 histidyl-tRNA synthase [Herbaspirillum rubrisubalbicans]
MSEQKKVEKIVGVKGMNDILPADAPLWELFENTVQSVLKSYGFQQIRTPIVEPTALFARGLGEVTDIVEKEMYSFTDSMNGDNLTLRPENTAGVVRAALEHNLTYDGPKRLWYVGPMFRHERPQRGRYRQFHQVGAEAVGFSGPDIDAELIMMCQRLWDDLGLSDIRLELNSIGNAEERNKHRADLIAYFEQHKELLDTDAQRRLHANPLRILDTKNPSMQEMVNAAPKLLDYLGEESRAHFEGVQKILRHNNIPFTINPRLVRGMDYYNRTVFEWVTDQLGSQGTVCGGGRYDPLIEMFGGKPTPACGFAMGVERLLELMKANGEQYAPNQCDVYLVHQGEDAQLQSFVLAERLRTAGLDVVLHCASSNGGGSFKAQMKRADASGAAFAVIIGEDELKAATATVKHLREGNAEEGRANQSNMAFDGVVDYIVEQIVGDHDHDHDHDHVHYHP